MATRKKPTFIGSTAQPHPVQRRTNVDALHVPLQPLCRQVGLAGFRCDTCNRASTSPLSTNLSPTHHGTALRRTTIHQVVALRSQHSEYFMTSLDRLPSTIQDSKDTIQAACTRKVRCERAIPPAVAARTLIDDDVKAILGE